MSAFQTGPTAEDGGLWHRIELPRPRPPRFQCAECRRTFQSQSELTTHGFAEHPRPRPRIAIDGIALHDSGSVTELFAPIAADRVRVEKVDTGYINHRTVEADEFPTAMASLESGFHEIAIANAHETRRFRVKVHIATQSDLDQVDEALRHYLLSTTMTPSDRTAFVRHSENATTASPYLAGLHRYLVGRVAKDRLEAVTMDPAQYRVDYNSAAERLAHFDRPIARVVCGLIRVHFNLFDQVAGMIPGSAADAIATYFLSPTAPPPLESPPEDGGALNLEWILADRDTRELLSWFQMTTATQDQMLNRTRDACQTFATQLDRDKAELILAHLRLQGGAAASDLAILRSLRRHNSFSQFTSCLIRD